ncbi:MAG: serine/threonine-protein kinase [Chloroflexota bacterium]
MDDKGGLGTAFLTRALLSLWLAALGALWPWAAALAQPAPQVLTVSAPSAVRPGEEFQVAVGATNPGPAAAQGSISVSFPDRPNVRIVGTNPVVGARSYARVFNTGDSILNLELNRLMGAQYPLAELYFDGAWPAGQQRFLIVAVRAPSGAAALNLQARATFRSADGRLANYPAAGLPRDQQGFSVTAMQVSVAQATVGATPGRSPTAAPTPSATATSLAAPTPSEVPVPTATPNAIVAVLAGNLADSSGQPSPSDDAVPPGAGSTLPVAPLAIATGGVALLAAVLITRRSERQPRAAPPEPSARAAPAPRTTQASAAEAAQATTAVPRLASARVVASASLAASGALPPGYQSTGPPQPGRLGAVYHAYQSALKRHVAVQMVSPALAGSAGFPARFSTLVPRLGKLEHANIASLLDAGRTSGSFYLITAWAEGQTLGEVLARQWGAMPLARTLGIAAQIAAALDFSHARLVYHGGLNPGNVVVGPEDNITVKGFGVAALAGGDRRAPLANLDYLAPEQAHGGAADRLADLYALGAVVYELLAGAPPRRGATSLAFPPRVPAELATVVARALSADPAARYQSGHAFLAALRQAAGQQV